MNDLAQHEERAQHGILEFADEMQAIRDGKLYPNASASTGGEQPWEAYCKERWGMSANYVHTVIQAAPVMRRRAENLAHGQVLTVGSARRVATLDVQVQDAILDESTSRHDVATMAKAAKSAAKAGRSVEAQIEAAHEVKPPKKPKRKMKPSKFIRKLGPVLDYAQDAADYAQSAELSEMENDWGWVILERVRLQLERIQDQLHRPISVRDVDEEASILLGGEVA